MARRTKEEALQTRETILTTALDMFCERGYSRTTFDEIAKRINRTKGAIYWHFKNKPDIIKALIIKTFDYHQTAIHQKLAEVNTLDDLYCYFQYAAQVVKDSPLFRKFLFFVMFQMEWSAGLFNTLNISTPINKIFNYQHNLIHSVLTKCVEQGTISAQTDIGQTTIIINALWDGILRQAISKKTTDLLPATAAQSFSLIFNSLKLTKEN